MDAHYDSQIKSHNQLTAQQNATFSGPARQMGAGAGGLGAFAMRMGRVAIPVVRKYILFVAKHFGKNLLEAAIPEIGQVLAGKKRPSSKMLKHVAETAEEKSLPKPPSVLSGGAPRRTSERAVERGRAPRRPAGVDQLRSNDTRRRRRNIVRPPSSAPSLSNSSPTIISRKKPAKRSRSEILSETEFVQFKNNRKNNTASILALVTTTSTAFSGRTMDIASPVTHSALDFFEKPSVLINC